ncbi:SAP domain-containing protein [Alkalibacterium putridalgicola]|uniref:SAP domain-containing protein n=1 Tax=Alkalibacterium putridalgicola TaxID=426703 RepID=UPI0034CE6449
MGIFNFSQRKKRKARHSNHRGEASRTERRTAPDILPVKKRIKRMKSNEDGLYPHEILLLSYAPSYYIEKNTYPKFWWYRYGVKHVDKWLKSLKKRGFLKVGSIESAIRNETAEDLKDILRAHDLKVSGNKAELVQRLLDSVPEDELNTLFRDRTYELTDKGRAVLAAEEHIPYIHRHSIEDLDIWSLNEKVKASPGYSYRDIVWEYMNKKSLKYYKHSDFGLYRNCRLSMAEFLEEEGKDDSAFIYLAEVVRIDLSGVSNGFSMDYMETYADSFFPYSTSEVKLAPGITDKIRTYQKEKDLSDDELKTKLIDLMNRLQLPFSLFTVEEAADIVVMEIDGDIDGLERIYRKAQKRFEGLHGVE